MCKLSTFFILWLCCKKKKKNNSVPLRGGGVNKVYYVHKTYMVMSKCNDTICTTTSPFVKSGHYVLPKTVPPIEPYVTIYGGSWRSATKYHFSSLLLWISIECAYCVAIVLLCLNVFFILVLEKISLVSKHFIDSVCIVAFAPATIMMTKAILHLYVMMLLISIWYFLFFMARDSS